MTYTQEHFPATSSVWPIVSTNFGPGFGRILDGIWTHRVLGPVQILGMCLVVAGLLQMVVWHLATTYAVTIEFGVLSGVFGSIAQSLVPAIVLQLSRPYGLVSPLPSKLSWYRLLQANWWVLPRRALYSIGRAVGSLFKNSLEDYRSFKVCLPFGRGMLVMAVYTSVSKIKMLEKQSRMMARLESE
jgi:hypothetical protein